MLTFTGKLNQDYFGKVKELIGECREKYRGIVKNGGDMSKIMSFVDYTIEFGKVTTKVTYNTSVSGAFSRIHEISNSTIGPIIFKRVLKLLDETIVVWNSSNLVDYKKHFELFRSDIVTIPINPSGLLQEEYCVLYFGPENEGARYAVGDVAKELKDVHREKLASVEAWNKRSHDGTYKAAYIVKCLDMTAHSVILYHAKLLILERYQSPDIECYKQLL